MSIFLYFECKRKKNYYIRAAQKVGQVRLGQVSSISKYTKKKEKIFLSYLDFCHRTRDAAQSRRVLMRSPPPPVAIQIYIFFQNR